jgi:hypothetical protein
MSFTAKKSDEEDDEGDNEATNNGNGDGSNTVLEQREPTGSPAIVSATVTPSTPT